VLSLWRFFSIWLVKSFQLDGGEFYFSGVRNDDVLIFSVKITGERERKNM
jgi:hypothetical protein